MNMKRIVPLLTAAALVVSMTACSSDTAAQPSEAAGVAVQVGLAGGVENHGVGDPGGAAEEVLLEIGFLGGGDGDAGMESRRRGDGHRLDGRVCQEFFKIIVCLAVELLGACFRGGWISVVEANQFRVVQRLQRLCVQFGNHAGANDAKTDWLDG